MKLLTGAQILIHTLIEQGADVVFGYPGGAVLNIYDALYEMRGEIRHVLVSHEQGAAHAADGYARSTGRTGVVIATSGPGATNLVTGIAAAYHDSVPLIAVTGNVTRDLIGRASFQEVDIVGITAPIVKRNYFVRQTEALADTVREAFEVANSGRKGPVLIDIPKDVTAQQARWSPGPRFCPRPAPRPPDAEIRAAAEMIEKSARPLIYSGGGVAFSDAQDRLRAFAEKIRAPVCTSMMGLGAIPASSPHNLGLVGMHGTAASNMAVSRCDLLIAIGARFSDRVAGNRLKFAQDAAILHIDIDRSEIAKNVPVDLALTGDAGECLERLTALLPDGPSPQKAEWLHEVLRHKAMNALPDAAGEGDEVNPREVILALQKVAGPDLIVATDVGQHQMFVAQYYPFQRARAFLSSCGLGAMGYGLGAANGAAVGNPGRPVALVTGDGSFHMNLQELAVSVTNKLPVVVTVMNNGVLGMVHQWQNLFYGGRYSSTELGRETDFVKLAEAFGAAGLRIRKRSEILPALTRAFAVGGPCVVDCVIDARQRVFPIIPPGAASEDMIYSEYSEEQR
ncbi:MAG: biosynthetic-type acetolactate synthase large subunit [Clostridiales bacterium]|jgi:acetolactate synthase-1/2/3 large subunit|nr:biosynthetic-type acetolactate synthase large subunit [Clostridiales bacterium]